MQYGSNEESVGSDLRVARRVAKRGQEKAIESKTRMLCRRK